MSHCLKTGSQNPVLLLLSLLLLQLLLMLTVLSGELLGARLQLTHCQAHSTLWLVRPAALLPALLPQRLPPPDAPSCQHPPAAGPAPAALLWLHRLAVLLEVLLAGPPQQLALLLALLLVRARLLQQGCQHSSREKAVCLLQQMRLMLMGRVAGVALPAAHSCSLPRLLPQPPLLLPSLLPVLQRLKRAL
jgi:hypothetical protein